MINKAGIFLMAIVVGGFVWAQQPRPRAKKTKPAKVATSAPMQMPTPTPIVTITKKMRPNPAGLALRGPKVEMVTNYGRMLFTLYNETPLHRDNFIRLVEQGFYDSLLFHRVINHFMIQGGDPESKRAKPGADLGEGEVGYKIPAEFTRQYIHKRGALAAARDNNPEKASSGCQFYIVQGKIFDGKELNSLRNNTNYALKTQILQDITNSDSVLAKLDDFKLRGDKEGLHKYMMDLEPKVIEIYKKMEVKYNPHEFVTYTTIGGTPHLDMNYTVFGELIEGFNVLDSISAVKTFPNDRPEKDVRMLKVRVVKQ